MELSNWHDQNKENEMRAFCTVLVVAILLFGGLSWADNWCPLTGNTYLLEADDITWKLSSFECIFGPGCQAECDLWYGNFEFGPVHYKPLPFVCESDGDVLITIDKIKIPCALNSQGDLECLTVDVSGYRCTQLGGKTWCFPVQSEMFKFNKEEIQ